MDRLAAEISAFLQHRDSETSRARQRVALSLACGLDIDRLGDDLEPASARRIELRMERALRRERRKGASGHWSYDLNRHIALKAALDGFRARHGLPGVVARPPQGAGDASRHPHSAMHRRSRPPRRASLNSLEG